MFTTRLAGLLVILLAVQGWCKPTKSTNGDELDYPDDVPSDYNDYSQTDDDSETPGAVELPPQIISQPESIRKRAGSTIMLPCLVKNAEDVAVLWKKDNSFLYSESNALTTEPDRIKRLPNNTLVIYNATVEDSSNQYRCEILTEPNPVSITHRLLIEPERVATSGAAPQSTPAVRVTPSDTVEVREGENVTLGCHTNIQPAPEIKWFRESERIENGHDIINGNYLTLQKVTRHQAGVYQCLAERRSANRMEKPLHGAITVIVHYTPEVKPEHEVVHTGIGMNAEVTCIVHAYPRARVTWYKDQQEVRQKERISMMEVKNKHTLMIQHVEKNDFGVYTCLAINDMGQDRDDLTLSGSPSKPILYGGELTKNESGLILKWRLESYSPITEYKLEYRRKGEPWKMMELPVTNGKGNQFTVEQAIEGLQPGSYEAILLARNAFGWSPRSSPHTFMGEYGSDEPASVKDSAVSIRPFGSATALFLVVLVGIVTSL